MSIVETSYVLMRGKKQREGKGKKKRGGGGIKLALVPGGG
jgi:hypothetical protein